MSHEPAPLPPGEEPRWLDNPANRDKVYYFVVASWWISVFISLPSGLYEKHPYMAFEQIPFFSAIYGLVCCIGLVLAAKWLRTILMRDEDYYER